MLTTANNCFLEGNYEQAICLYREALSQGNAIEIYWHNLILALLKTGREADANKEIYLSLTTSPESGPLNNLLSRSNRKHISSCSGPKLSIIVPAYNSEKYLKKCIRSILKQNYSDFELIVVNDGSSDDTAEIISEYAEQDDRIKIITNLKPSGNPGTPRNQALEIASGAYIGFVDSDDWIEPDYYMRLMEKALSDASDMVFSGGFINQRKYDSEVRKYGQFDFSDHGSASYKYHESFMIWDKIFSSKLIKSFDIKLGETKAAVDVPFILKAYYLAHRVSFCWDLYSYNYLRESDSSVTVNYRKASDCSFELQAFRDIEVWSCQANVNKKYKELISFRKVNSFIYTLNVIAPEKFDVFFRQAKEAFSEMDSQAIFRYSKLLKKRHIQQKFTTTLNHSPEKYKSKFRKELSASALESKKTQVADRQTFHLLGENNGIMFFPDWSSKNPYQKLLYASLAKNYRIRVKGYNEKLFRKDLLDSNQENFDYIHLHWLHVYMDFTRDDGAQKFIETIKYAQSLGYKIIYTAHNVVSHDSVYVEREKLFRATVAHLFDYILVHGELARRRVISELGVNEDKVHLIPHGSYEGYYPNFTNRAISRSRFGIEDDEYVYLFFGNIKGYKGVDKLLSSYKDIRCINPKVRLIVAGRVFDEEVGLMIKDYVDSDESIIFRPGFIEENEAQYFFNAADVVVLPYKRILTSGAAILSLSFNKPVIAPRDGVIPEIIEDGKQGYLYSDFEDMKKIMLQVAVNTNSEESFEEEAISATNAKLRWGEITKERPFVDIFDNRFVKDQKQALVEGSKSYEYALLRILGNDLPQRHDPNQTLTNLEFTLRHESEFDDCVKIWVLNRIIDKDKKRAIIDLLNQYKKEYVDIPFDSKALIDAPYAFEDLPKENFKLCKEFKTLSKRNKTIVDAVVLKNKNRYLMNNNGARNKALSVGKSHARWAFPWDGNCFVTDTAWQKITSMLVDRDDMHYHIVSMDRVLSNDGLLENDYEHQPVEEPQVIFRDDADLSFNEDLMYGFKPKVDLLKKLGVPGKWDEWTNLYPWKKHEIEHDHNSFNYAWCGWTARLFSGNKSQELKADDRSLNRERGIVQYIRSQEVEELFKDFDERKLAYYDEQVLASLVGDISLAGRLGLEQTLKNLKEKADDFVHNPLYSVTTKTTLAPSGDPKDYWHPAPYYWPNPNKEGGLPYIRKDGQRVLGTKMYEPDSAKYDRTSIQRLFDETTTLALAGCVFSERRYTQKAYDLIKAWFIDPNSSMNPNLNFAQVVMGKNNNNGNAVGLIETKDLYFFLDAIRLVKRSDLWEKEDEEALNKWFSVFFKWLNLSEQGLKESKAINNHGNAYDLQVYAIAAFLGMQEEMYDIMLRAASRIRTHIDEDGQQPHEMERTTTAHYTAFNLHLWINLSSLMQKTIGVSLIDMKQKYGENYKNALLIASSWVLQNGKLPEWPYKQIDAFDKARYEHIFYSLASNPEIDDRHKEWINSFDKAKDVFYPHDGIAPYWKLSLKYHSDNTDAGASDE